MDKEASVCCNCLNSNIMVIDQKEERYCMLDYGQMVINAKRNGYCNMKREIIVNQTNK